MFYLFVLGFLFVTTSNSVFSQISVLPLGPVAFLCPSNYVPSWHFGAKKIYVNRPNCDLRVGIGTDTPEAKLHVAGSAILGNTIINRLKVGKSAEANMAGMITGVLPSPVPTPSTYPLINLGIYNPNSSTNDKSSIFKVEANGSLTLTNGTERIFEINAANRTVYSHEIILQKQQFWPDYVFKEEYKLMPTDQLKKFIENHHHLPNIPKAEDVYKDGLSLGDMNKRLLEKVEELTLYMLKQQDEIEKLKVCILQLEQQDKN